MHRYEEDGIDALGWFLWGLLRVLVVIGLVVLIAWMGGSNEP